jgi:ubiquinone/menaquinone biosynthesis C-methylase UbiE
MDWNSKAEQYSIIQDTRRQIVFPWVRDFIASMGCRSLLDFGCGDGDFARMCASIQGLDIIIYDPAPNMCEIARKNTARIANIHVMDKIPEQSFDVATLLTVWMCLPTDEDCIRVLHSVHDCLKQNGLLIVSVTHPCFRNCKFSTYRTNFDIKTYLNEGIKFKVTIDDGAHSIDVEDTHWNLESMSRQLHQSGFVIEAIKEMPDLMINQAGGEGSPWMIIIASKSCGGRLKKPTF